MKKGSLFLTTLLMVILLVVALSTATFAWFSASNSVTVSTISFTASSKHGESELHIGWTDTADTVDITFANPVDMGPMVPKALPKVGADATTYTDFMTDNFYTASQSDGANAVFVGRVAKVYPTVCVSGVEGDDGTFYLINGNPNLDMNAKLEYEIDGDLSAALCIAVFAEDKLVGIASSGDSIRYGQIVLGASVDSLSSTPTTPDSAVKGSGDIQIRVPKGAAVPVKLVAWYGGNALGNDGAQQTAVLKSIEFVGEYA